jgi:hypothetical protein
MEKYKLRDFLNGNVDEDELIDLLGSKKAKTLINALCPNETSDSSE